MRFCYFHILLKLNCNAFKFPKALYKFDIIIMVMMTIIQEGRGRGGGRGVMVNFTLRPGETTFAA